MHHPVLIWLFHNPTAADADFAADLHQLLPEAEWVEITSLAEFTAVSEQATRQPNAAVIPISLRWANAHHVAEDIRLMAADCPTIVLTQGKITIPQLPSGHLISLDHSNWGEALRQVVENTQVRQHTAALARRQTEILSLLSSVSQQIFLPGQLEQVLGETLPQLGQILELNRIMLFEQENRPHTTPQFHQRYQWNVRTTPALHINHPRWPKTTFEEWGIEAWLKKLSSGEAVVGNAADFPAAEAEFLRDIMHTEAVLMVPIFSGHSWWGFLALDDDQHTRQWQPTEIDALLAFANVLGAAIENARLFTAERRQLNLANTLSDLSQRQTDELASLYDISVSLTGVLEPRTIMERLENHITHLLQPDIILAVFHDEEAHELQIITAHEQGQPIELAPLGYRLPIAGGGMSGWVARNKKVLLIGDLNEEEAPVDIHQITKRMPRTWLGMPLLANGRVVGVISVQSYQAYAYDREHVRFLEMVATQAALAIESARLFQHEMSRRHEAELLNKLTAELNNSALDHNRILTSALEAVRQFIPDMSIGVINMLDETEQFLIPQALSAAEPRFIITPLGQRIPIIQTQMARQVLEEKRTIIQEDVQKNPLHNERAQWVASQGLSALLYVPVFSKSKVIGLLNVNMWDKPRHFRRAEIEFCETVATHVGITLENARLYALEARRRQEAELLHTLTATLIETTDLVQIAENALSAIHLRIPHLNRSSISLLDKTEQYMEPLVSWGQDAVPPMFQERVLLAQTNSSYRAIAERRTIFVPDLRQLATISGRTQSLIEAGMRTLLYIPLLLQERAIGLMQLHGWDEPYYFTAAEISFCEAVSNHVAIAAENARLLAGEREQLHLAQTLRDVGALLTTSLRLDEVFERIFDLLAQVIHYDSVTLQMHDEVNDLMYLAAGRGFRDMVRTAAVVEMLGADTIGRMRESTYQIISDTTADPNWIRVENFDPIRSSIRCALRIKDKLVGVLNVDSFTPYSYTHEMAQTVVAFANQAVVAIENARLYDEINQRVEKLSIFNEVAMITTTSHDADSLIRDTTNLLANRLYRERFGFLLLDETKQYLIVHESYYQQRRATKPLNKFPLHGTRGITSHVARTGQIYICHDALEDPLYLEYDPLTRSELVVPLTVDGEVIGVINVESARPNAFDEEDANFLFTLAHQMATAIQRAQLYEDSRFYAAQLSEKVAYRTAELQEERDRTRAILDSAGEGMVFTDSEGVIVYANPAMSIQTGYSHDELVGHTPNILNSGLTPKRVFEELWQTIRRGQRWRGEVTNRRKDGSLYAASLTITPLYDQQHELRGFVSIQSDITQLKELDRLKSEFVTNVSHELRTPLTNIRTFVTLLKMGKPEKLDHYRQVLERETDRLTRLIQDLLDLSRIETNTIRTNLHAEDIGTLLENLVQSFMFKAQEKQIELEDNWSNSLPPVLMDKDQMTQVLSNLLGNALAYTPAHGRITLHAAVRDYNGQEMMAVLVQDTGMGLDEEDKRRLFERFYRGRAATESRAPGTGLGLAISKEIIARHQGAIEVESEVGRGTSFIIWLPLAE